ncbi:hypothetical protein KCU76_g117, partial [Aureobasidium melanogenum]
MRKETLLNLLVDTIVQSRVKQCDHSRCSARDRSRDLQDATSCVAHFHTPDSIVVGSHLIDSEARSVSWEILKDVGVVGCGTNVVFQAWRRRSASEQKRPLVNASSEMATWGEEKLAPATRERREKVSNEMGLFYVLILIWYHGLNVKAAEWEDDSQSDSLVCSVLPASLPTQSLCSVLSLCCASLLCRRIASLVVFSLLHLIQIHCHFLESEAGKEASLHDCEPFPVIFSAYCTNGMSIGVPGERIRDDTYFLLSRRPLHNASQSLVKIKTVGTQNVADTTFTSELVNSVKVVLTDDRGSLENIDKLVRYCRKSHSRDQRQEERE